MKKTILVLAAAALLQGCSNVGRPAEREEAAPAVYEREREFTFLASHYDAGGSLDRLDTLVLRTSGETLRDSDGQTRSSWAVRGENGWRSYSGIVENDTAVWIHPPRTGVYRKLELSPFPMVQYPLEPGNRWSWSLLVGSHYSMDGHAAWTDTTTKEFTSSYQVVREAPMSTSLGVIDCYEIDSYTKSDFRRTELKAFYSQAYGFIKLDYLNIDKGRLTLELVKAVQPGPVAPFTGFGMSKEER